MTPSGSEQILSLRWALKETAGLKDKGLKKAVCDLVGLKPSEWESLMIDDSWFIGDSRWHSPEVIASLWNERYARLSKVWLDDEAWLTPLWQLWLPEKKMIFAANLNYLFHLQGRGSRTRLAKFIGRNPTTSSRWGNWQKEGSKVRIPPQTAVLGILDFFQLPARFDLTQDPLFLGRSDVHDDLQRIRGRHYLASLRGRYLEQAVERLREESDRQTAERLNSIDDQSN